MAKLNVNAALKEQCITQRPSHIAIDPYYLTLDNNRDDNVMVVN